MTLLGLFQFFCQWWYFVFSSDKTDWLAKKKQWKWLQAKLGQMHSLTQLKIEEYMFCQVSLLGVICNKSALQKLYWLMDRIKNGRVTRQDL